MNTQHIKNKISGLVFLLFIAMNSFAQYKTEDEAKTFINDRLSHSILQRIDPDGTVTMNTPSEKIKFNLHTAAFNYNDGNNDDRLRVTSEDGIEHYEAKVLVEKTSRQSFLCESENDAKMVIEAFRFLKKKYGPDPKNVVSNIKKLNTGDSSLNVKTVAEAIDFINENLSYSVITGIDEKGMMMINSPEENYRVNLVQAEFGYNDADDGSKVRIYGDFCITQLKNGDEKEVITRKSFQTQNRVKAYKAITVLYYLKSTYANIDPHTIPGLKNLCAVRVAGYSTPDEAIGYINARLSYSIILGIDKQGNITLNAPEEIYRFNLNDVKISSAINHKTHSDWFSFVVNGGSTTGVLVECNNCIKKFDSPGSSDELDEQVFQCGSSSEARDVLKAFYYLRGSFKK